MFRHYRVEELDLYLHGRMSALDRICCSVHVKECRICAARVEKLRKDDQLISTLRSSVRAYRELSEKPQRHGNSRKASTTRRTRAGTK